MAGADEAARKAAMEGTGKESQVQTVNLTDFLTKREINAAIDIYEKHGDNGETVTMIEHQVIAPNMRRINRKLKQENNPRYLAYAVFFVISQGEKGTK